MARVVTIEIPLMEPNRNRALAKEAAPVNADLDTLVQEGKRVQKGKGATPGNIQAFKLFYEAASAGHPEAQFLISEYYRFEMGVNLTKAEYQYWLRKSAESGFAAAQNAIGFETDNDSEAVIWFQKAAQQNYSKAMLNLGRLAENAADLAEAANWYRKAADLGNSWAQFLLGEFYSKGNGVDQDDQEAAKWWRKAAEQGEKWAQYELGTCYATGRGVPLHDQEAVKWWTKAAEMGSWRACYDLGICYARGKGIPRNKVQAYRWLRIAAETSADETIREKAKAEAASLEMLMSSSEIQAGRKLCREFDDQRRSREPRWMTEVFKGTSVDQK
jgi:uncharacterized protein